MCNLKVKGKLLAGRLARTLEAIVIETIVLTLAMLFFFCVAGSVLGIGVAHEQKRYWPACFVLVVVFSIIGLICMYTAHSHAVLVTAIVGGGLIGCTAVGYAIRCFNMPGDQPPAVLELFLR